MLRPRTAFAFALVVVTAIGGAGLWLRHASPVSTIAAPSAASGTPGRHPVASEPAMIPPESTIPAAPLAPVASADLARRLATSTNHREFVAYALAHPEDGGVFYAGLAQSQCLQARTQLEHAPALEPQGPRAEALIRARRVVTACEGLEEQFGGARNLWRLMAEAAKRGPDPLQAESLRRDRMKDPEDAWRRASALGDPQLTAATIESIGVLVVALRHPDLIDSVSPSLAHQAAVSLACEVGGFCEGLMAMGSCIQEGCSAIDLRRQIEDRLSEAERVPYRRFLALMRSELLGQGGAKP